MEVHLAFQCNSGQFGAMVAPTAFLSSEVVQMATKAERREARQQKRDARAYALEAWRKYRMENPDASDEEMLVAVAADAKSQGFDPTTILLILELIAKILEVFRS